jgi:hypothetical protein
MLYSKIPTIANISDKNIGLDSKESISYILYICSVNFSTFPARIKPINSAGLENLCRLQKNPSKLNTKSIAKSSQPPVYCVQLQTIKSNSIGK